VRGSAGMAAARSIAARLGLALLPAFVAGCISETPWRQWSPALHAPGQYELVRDHLVLRSDFPLSADHQLVGELTARRQDIARELALPLSDQPIHVYLFENAEAFAGYLKLYFPALPARRAYFIESDTQLTVYAQWGPRVAEDLRHEVTHGILHAAVRRIPLWLDEGLAEYFETPQGQSGLNAEHLAWMRPRLARGVWRPNLERLEQLPPTAAMTGDDYAEAWGWVHFLLHGPAENRRALQTYLADVRRGAGEVEALSVRLGRQGDPAAGFLEHARQWFVATPPVAAGGPVGSVAPGRGL